MQTQSDAILQLGVDWLDTRRPKFPSSCGNQRFSLCDCKLPTRETSKRLRLEI